MRHSINKAEVRTLESIQERLEKMYRRIEEKDVQLHYGNGTVSEQINCAIAALDCILQEF